MSITESERQRGEEQQADSDAIDRLQAEIARLRGLLRACVETWDADHYDDTSVVDAIEAARKEVQG